MRPWGVSFINPNVRPDDDPGMSINEPIDIAKEPVDRTDDAGFMDTGVLHQERICTECGNDLACAGYQMCSDCLEELGHDGR